MVRPEWKHSSVTVLAPILAGLGLAACGGGPEGTCTAFDISQGDRIAVGNGTVAQDSCFEYCRDQDNLFECRFTPSARQTAVLPVEPILHPTR